MSAAIDLARHVLKIHKGDEYGLPCWGCEERDDDGHFQPHSEDCPRSLLAHARRVIKAAPKAGGRPC